MPILNNFFKLNSMNDSILSLNENKFPRINPIKIHKNAEEISKLKFDEILRNLFPPRKCYEIAMKFAKKCKVLKIVRPDVGNIQRKLWIAKNVKK